MPDPGHLKEFCFKPGQSGNPSGRPKGSVSLIAELRKILNETDKKTRKKNSQLVMEKLLEHAKKGNIKHIREILDRIEGKPISQVSVVVGGELESMSEEELDRIIGQGNDDDDTETGED